MWSPEHGLPTSGVLDITQTPDGYLWLSTTGGLARFDGLRFEVFGLREGLPTNRLQGLAVDRDGRLYVSCEDGSLVRWGGERFERWASPVNAAAWALAVLPDGSLLGSMGGRHWRFEDGRFEVIPASNGGYSPARVDARGMVGLTTPDGAPARLEGTRVVRMGPPGSPLDGWIRDARDGRLLFWARRGADAELLDIGMRPVVRLPGAGPEWAQCIDGEGRLWSFLGSGLLAREVRSGRVVARVELGIADAPTRLFADRHDNLWVGTTTQGLMRVSPSAVTLLREPGRERPQRIAAAAELADGRVLAFSDRFRRWVVDGGGLRPLGTWYDPVGFAGDAKTRYRSLGDAVEVGDATGTVKAPTRPSAWLPNMAADPARPRSVLVNFEYALLRFSAVAGSAARETVLAPGAPIRHFAFDREGRLWVATTAGLWRVAPGDTQRFTTRDGLPTDHVRQIHVARDGRLWIGSYGGGLVRWAGGRFASLDHARGLLDDVVSVVLEDDDGHLWLGGNAGLQRVRIEEADACLDGRRPRVNVVVFGRGAGLRNPEGTGAPGLRTRDGRLWFPTFDGLAVVDPRRAVALRTGPPSPVIEALLVDGRASLPAGGSFTTPRGQERLAIRYTGIDLRAPELVRFRYRLDGVDRDWIDAGASRVATYTNVPPGRRVFRLVAVSGDGAESDAAEVVIERPPSPWETRTFAVAVAAALVLGAALAWRWRSRRLVARARALERAVDERTSELLEAQARTQAALATVEAQAQRLEALDRARSRFFASISHEFRTPLTLVLGPLRDVREGLVGRVEPAVAEQVGIALDSAARLQRLVDQMLDAARAEAGELRVEPQPGDLVPFLADLAHAFAPLAERKRITFECALPDDAAPAAFDAPALEKVFANLLGNAFKFTPAGGHVTLSARSVEDGGRWLEVAVRDDGPGIAAEDLPHVFRRFYRSERPATRLQPGTGLGLALAADMVEQHGGAIRAESVEGRGSTFTVRLPLLAVEAEAAGRTSEPSLDPETLRALADEVRIGDAPPPPVEPPTGEDAPTVLVVDDNPDVRAYVARQVRRHYRVVEADDGARALERMRAAVPDVVVSDVMMPVMDGLALVRAVRSDPELESVPVVLLTAAASSESRVAGIEGGADDYLTKPFEVRELLVRIARLLDARRRLRDRLARAAARAVVHGESPPAEALEPAAPAEARAHPAQGPVEAAFLRRLREVVEARLGDEDFDVGRLAEAMGVGRTLLYQKVSELTGRTPSELLYEHRLERATQLLAEPRSGVGEVAYAVGFRSVSHFTNRFRERFGVTPSAWRHGERPGPPSPGPAPGA